MEELFLIIYNWFKKFSPYILVGAIGAIVHRFRTKMSWNQFFASVFISVLVSLSVGVVCQEYTLLKNDVIFVLCGISGTFSKHILDELEEIVGDLLVYIRGRLGIKRPPSDDSKNM